MAHHDDQRPAIGRWRSALATTVASTALFAYSGRPVRAQTVPPAAPCNQVSGGGTTVTCTGDVSTGVLLNNGGGPFTTLNIVDLTDDITPASTVDGIRFTSLGGITINSDTGPFAIISTARGIYANSSSGQPVTIRSNGDIVSVGDGIDGRSGSGDVAVASTGDITTTGAIADGIYAYAYNGTIAIASTGDITTQGAGGYGIRSFGSLGATGIASFGNITTAGDYARGIGAYSLLADVAIASTGNITTGGFNAHGIYAHVVSGAGEVAITSTGNITTRGTGAVGILVDVDGSGDVAIASFGNIATFGDTSYGIKATANGDVTIDSLGTISTGGASSTGIFAASTTGSVSVSSSGNIVTLGDDADGVAATSNGGPVTITSNADIATSGQSASAIRGGVQGDPLTITSFGNIATEGNNSFGIAGGSITGSVTITSTGNIATEGTNSAAINVGTIGTDGTDDGGITINSYGNIATAGTNAIGINASSVYGAISIASYGDVAVAGAGSIGINAQTNGDVTITSFGNITTSGMMADGIAAVTSGSVEIVNTGDISATANGIYAGGQAGNLVINIGTIEGCPCAGVLLVSNGNNRLYNYGSIIAEPGGSAIESDGANNQVENFGVVTGNVLFFDGMNPGTGAFTNHAGALFNTGDVVMAGLVTNDGTIAPGGVGAVQMTALGESFVQNAGGIFAIDIDGSTSDALIVSNTADLAGKVSVNFLGLPALITYTILEADGLMNNGLGLIASPALNATLQFNGNDLELVFAIDFSTSGLNPNERAIADNLDKIFAAGGGGVTPVLLGLLNTVEDDEYKHALDQLSPELYSDAQIAALYSSLAFSNSLLSCKVNGTDTASIIREGQCLWVGASARFLNSSTTTDQIGFDETAGLFTAGAQVALDDVWRLGVAGSYQSSTMQTATGAQSEGSLAQGGVSLKYNPGPLLVAGALTAGGASYDTTRPMAFGGFSGVAEGNQDLGIFSAAFRAAYVFGSPSLYFKPIVDASLTRLELSGFTESGGNGAALSVDGGGHTVFSVAPMLEAGTEWWLGNDTLIRPLIRGGAVWYDGADFALTASLAGAPLGVSPFTINTNIDEVMGLVGAGFEVINGGDAVLRLSYDGQFGSDTQIHSVGIKGSSKF